jgi:hypothetical protein
MIAMAEAAATTATAKNQKKKKRTKNQKHTSLSLPSLTRPFTHVPKCIHIWIRTSIGDSKFKPESGGYCKLFPWTHPGIIQGMKSENHGYKKSNRPLLLIHNRGCQQNQMPGWHSTWPRFSDC